MLEPLKDEVFDGEKTVIELKSVKCSHDLFESSWDIKCRKCPVIWPMLARYARIENNTIIRK